MALRDVHDRVHLATDASVMHGHDDLGLRRDGGFDLGLVDVERVFSNIYKYGSGTAQNEGIGGRHKGVGRHDDFVAGLYTGQYRRHLEGTRARVRQKRLLATNTLLEPATAFLGELAVSCKVTTCVSLRDVPEFLAGHVGFIEWHLHRLSLWF